MRSTVDLQPELDKRLREAASKQGLTFKEALNRVIAAGLHALQKKPQTKHYRVKAKACGLAKGIDHGKLNQLYDVLESEADQHSEGRQ